MNRLDTLQTDLTKARDALTVLQNELPQFYALLTENEQDAQRLKTDRAPLDAQAQAKGRVNVAREMLEQHQADIATARAEVGRLGALVKRERTLDEMTGHARQAAEHRTALEQAVAGAVKDLQHGAALIIREWSAFTAAKEAFVGAGAEELGTLMWPSEPTSMGLVGDSVRQLEARVLSTLEAVKARGVDLSCLLEGDTVGLHYRTERPLPQDGLALLVWAAVLSFDDTPGDLKRRAPKPRGGVYAVTSGNSGDRYRL